MEVINPVTTGTGSETKFVEIIHSEILTSRICLPGLTRKQSAGAWCLLQGIILGGVKVRRFSHLITQTPEITPPHVCLGEEFYLPRADLEMRVIKSRVKTHHSDGRVPPDGREHNNSVKKVRKLILYTGTCN